MRRPLLLLATFAFALFTAGCAGSFEEARLVSRPMAATPDADRARCVKLDDERIEDSAKAKGLGTIAGTAAGATGLIHYLEPMSREVVAIGGVVTVLAAAGAGYFLVRSEGKSTAWVRECSK